MNETMERLKEKARGLLKNRNLLRWAGVLAVCGLLLVWLASRLESAPAKQPEEPTASCTQAAVESALEQRLQPIVSAITGEAGDRILVTLVGDAQTVYATEGTAGETDSETSYVIVKNADGSQSALRLTEICPEVKGVVVATTRAEDPMIRERLVAAVTTAFGISSSRVCVVLSN